MTTDHSGVLGTIKTMFAYVVDYGVFSTIGSRRDLDLVTLSNDECLNELKKRLRRNPDLAQSVIAGSQTLLEHTIFLGKKNALQGFYAKALLEAGAIPSLQHSALTVFGRMQVYASTWAFYPNNFTLALVNFLWSYGGKFTEAALSPEESRVYLDACLQNKLFVDFYSAFSDANEAYEKNDFLNAEQKYTQAIASMENILKFEQGKERDDTYGYQACFVENYRQRLEDCREKVQQCQQQASDEITPLVPKSKFS